MTHIVRMYYAPCFYFAKCANLNVYSQWNQCSVLEAIAIVRPKAASTTNVQSVNTGGSANSERVEGRAVTTRA